MAKKKNKTTAGKFLRAAILILAILWGTGILGRGKLPGDNGIYLSSGSGVPLLLQTDPLWKDHPYGSGTVGSDGCGPTCLSMVAVYYGHEEMNPAWMADYAAKNGYWRSEGTAWSLMTEGAKALGLSSAELPLSEKKIKSHLEDGEPIICSVGPGDFTNAGHFIVLTGLKDGKIRVNDPFSRINSGKLWTYEQLSGQIKNLWVFFD